MLKPYFYFIKKELTSLRAESFVYLDFLLPMSWFFAIVSEDIDKPVCGILISVWLLLGLAANKGSSPWNILMALLVISQLKDLIQPEIGLFSTAGDLIVMAAAFGVCYKRSSVEWYTTQRIVLLIIFTGLLLAMLNFFAGDTCDTLICFEGVNRNRSAFVVGYAGITAASLSLFSKDLTNRILGAFGTVIALLLVIGLGSRAGIIIPLFSLCAAACMTTANKLISKRLFLIGILGIALSVILAIYYYSPISSSASRNIDSDIGRMEMQKCYLRKTLKQADSVLLGSGQGADQLAKGCYKFTIARHHAHNYYIQILGENGLIAAISLLGLLIFSIIKSTNLLASAEDNLRIMQAYWGLSLIVYISIYAIIESLPLRFGLIQVLHAMALAIPFAKDTNNNISGEKVLEQGT